MSPGGYHSVLEVQLKISSTSILSIPGAAPPFAYRVKMFFVVK